MLKNKIHLRAPQLDVPAVMSTVVAAPEINKPSLFRASIRGGNKGLKSIVISDPQVRKQLQQFKVSFPAQPQKTMLPGLEYIGCGYNVFGRLSEPSGVKQRMLDFSKVSVMKEITLGDGKKYIYPNVITAHNLNHAQVNTYSGETATKYVEDLSVAAGVSGGFMGFQAEVSTQYSYSEITSYYSAFTFVQQLIESFNLMLNGSGTELRSYLVPDALAALDNYPYKSLDGKDLRSFFHKYGLYLLKGYAMGSRIHYTSVTDMFKYASKMDLEVIAKASFLSLIGGSIDVETRRAVDIFNKSSQTTWESFGGDEALGITLANFPSETNYKNWIATVKANPQMVAFTDVNTCNPLLPVWELTKNAQRRQIVMDAAKRYIEDIIVPQIDWTVGNPDRQVKYAVKIHTANMNNAGTDAVIEIRLKGKDRFERPYATDWRNFSAAGDKMEQNHTDIELYYAKDLGDLKMIEIRNRGGGSAPGCYLDTIEVNSDAPYAMGKVWQIKKLIDLNPGQDFDLPFQN
jgi:PLAT/LH2 domain/MAC/Perforin domain